MYLKLIKNVNNSRNYTNKKKSIKYIMANANNKSPTYKIVCFQNRFTTGVGIELISWKSNA